MLSLHLPMHIDELRQRIGSREISYSSQPGVYRWNLPPPNMNLLNAWVNFRDPSRILAITITHNGEYWLIDKNDAHCAPDRTAFEHICLPEFLKIVN